MGQAVVITNSDHSAADLRRIASREKDGQGARRDGQVVRWLLALALILEGRSRTEAAQMNGMDRQTLRDWVHRHNADGVSGLKSRVAVGPLPLLDEAQMTELRELVVSGRTRRSQGRTERIAGIRMGADRLTSADGARHAP